MTASAAIPGQLFREALQVAGDRVRAARNELCALDASAGDGDLGATLDTGFAEVAVWLESAGDEDDIGVMLREVGLQLARKAPSTIGTLMASGFIRAGTALAGATELGPEEAVTLLESAASGVADRGQVEVGQRTIFDAMNAAAVAASSAAKAGNDAADVLRVAATGAGDGAAATAEMEPHHGRAGWIKERARGSCDAGAVAWAIYLDGLAQACNVPAAEQVNPA